MAIKTLKCPEFRKPVRKCSCRRPTPRVSLIPALVATLLASAGGICIGQAIPQAPMVVHLDACNHAKTATYVSFHQTSRKGAK